MRVKQTQTCLSNHSQGLCITFNLKFPQNIKILTALFSVKLHNHETPADQSAACVGRDNIVRGSGTRPRRGSGGEELHGLSEPWNRQVVEPRHQRGVGLREQPHRRDFAAESKCRHQSARKLVMVGRQETPPHEHKPRGRWVWEGLKVEAKQTFTLWIKN